MFHLKLESNKSHHTKSIWSVNFDSDEKNRISSFIKNQNNLTRTLNFEIIDNEYKIYKMYLDEKKVVWCNHDIYVYVWLWKYGPHKFQPKRSWHTSPTMLSPVVGISVNTAFIQPSKRFYSKRTTRLLHPIRYPGARKFLFYWHFLASMACWPVLRPIAYDQRLRRCLVFFFFSALFCFFPHNVIVKQRLSTAHNNVETVHRKSLTIICSYCAPWVIHIRKEKNSKESLSNWYFWTSTAY